MSLQPPAFSGGVSDAGKLSLDNRAIFDALLKSLAGKRVKITVKEEKPRRSNKANRLWHGLIVDSIVAKIANEAGYDRHEHEAVHYELVKLWGGTHKDEVTGFELPNKRSSELEVEEFADLIDWAVRFAAEKFNLFILLPGDMGDKQGRPRQVTQPRRVETGAHA